MVNIICKKVNIYELLLLSLGFRLHNAHTITIMSSTCFLFVQLHNVAEKALNSFSLLIAFPTLIRTLVINLDHIACSTLSHLTES